ncbi:MAG: MFS transporter [Anaerovibrio sp.]|uniref:MFS transporter n=1 Tax=Anaerovibrio sp. TaxID=1872532 RepID=UPI0025E67826|nr:MFS transporter [Anaerovibrio sp.]MCR5175871.1 MFS transporter [Anaerovibrio sp.]
MQKLVLYAVMITSFVGAFVGSGINVAVPSIGHEFDAGAGDMSRFVSAYMFGSAIFTLPLGKAADILGRKKLYKIGITLFAITLIIAGFSQSVEFLTTIRFLQGGFMAMVFGPGMAVLVSVYDKSMRGKILGYSTAAVYVGLTCGPALGGLICTYIGWRWFFFLTGAIAALGLVFLARVKEEWYGEKGAPFDYKGSLCYMMMAPLLLYGFSEISSQEIGLYLFLLGIAGFFLFVYIEGKTRFPMLDVNLFVGNRGFSCSNLAAMLHYAATFATSFLLAVYLQVICGLGAAESGLILLLQFVMMALLSPAAGALSDRIDPGKVASVGMGINCIGLAVLSLLDQESSLLLVGGVLIAIGIGFALFASPNNNAILSSIPSQYYGTASSMLAAMRIIGQALSMAIVTIVMDVNAVKSMTGDDNDGLLLAMQVTYRICAVICMAGVVASLIRGKNKMA